MKNSTRNKLIKVSKSAKAEKLPLIIVAKNNDKTFLIANGTSEQISSIFQNAFKSDPDLWRTVKHATDQFAEIPKEIEGGDSLSLKKV